MSAVVTFTLMSLDGSAIEGSALCAQFAYNVAIVSMRPVKL